MLVVLLLTVWKLLCVHFMYAAVAAADAVMAEVAARLTPWMRYLADYGGVPPWPRAAACRGAAEPVPYGRIQRTGAGCAVGSPVSPCFRYGCWCLRLCCCRCRCHVCYFASCGCCFDVGDCLFEVPILNFIFCGRGCSRVQGCVCVSDDDESLSFYPATAADFFLV